MQLWTKSNTLWLAVIPFIILVNIVPKPFNYIFILPAIYFAFLASRQRFKYEIPKPGNETAIDRAVGGLVVFFIFMVIIIFSTFAITAYFPNTIDLVLNNLNLFVILLFSSALVGFFLQFFYGFKKSSSQGLSKAFIIVVAILLFLLLLYILPKFFPSTIPALYKFD